MQNLSDIDKKILDDFQRDLPIASQPYAYIAGSVGLAEEAVIEKLQTYKSQDLISRVGPIFAHNKVGASTLAAVSAPEDCFDDVATFIGLLPEVNHHYAREHRYNLWFVLTASSQNKLDQVISLIEDKTGMAVLNLPMKKAYCIDLGFKLWD